MNKLRTNSGRTFRFPFDIDRRVFLFLAGLFFILSIKQVNQYIFSRITPKTICKEISNDFSIKLNKFDALIEGLTHENITYPEISSGDLENLNEKTWSFFVLKEDSLLFWSKSTNLPVKYKNNVLDSLYTYQSTNELGFLIKKRKKIAGIEYDILGKFPLYVRYKVRNDLFKSNFSFLNEMDLGNENFGYRLDLLDYTSKGDYIVYVDDVPRFQLKETNSFLETTDKNFWHFFLVAIPFVLFGVSIHTYFKVSVKYNPALYFSLLVLTATIIRGLGYCYGFPDNFHEFHLFNPSLYGSDGLNTSLGDVFINACLLFWILFFYIMNVQNKVFKLRLTWHKFLFIVIYAMMLLGFLYISGSNIRSIIYDSKLNFDTTDYHDINPEAIIGLGAMLLTFMNYVLFAIIFNRYFEKYFPKKRFKYLVPLAGVILSIFLLDPSVREIAIIASVWTGLLLLLLSIRFLNTKLDFTSDKLIYWLIFFSVSCVVVIHYFDIKNEHGLRQNFAENLIRFENKNTEGGLIRLGTSMRDDTTLHQINNADEVQKYISRNYIFLFETEYRTSLEVRNRLEDNTAEQEQIEYSRHNSTKRIRESNPTIFLSNEIGKEKYILYHKLGNFSVKLTLSTLLPSSQDYSTTLAQDMDIGQDTDIPVYQYAYYANNKLVKQSSIDIFPLKLPKAAQKTTGVIDLNNRNRNSDIIVHNTNGQQKKSIVVRKIKSNFYRISTTYAYIFTIVFMLISLYILGNVIARSNLRRKRFINLLGLTLRMRIHLSILFVELISLVIIGFFTILLLSNDARNNALRKATVAADEIHDVLEGFQLQYDTDSVLGHKFKSAEIQSKTSPYLEKHNVGLNLYSKNGQKILSTVSAKLNNCLPNLINPKAYAELKIKPNVPSLQGEQIASFDYYSIYSNLRNQNNEDIGILEIANFSSHQMIRQNNSNIITMLINIYAFVFLLSSLFAFYITKRLTNSFSKIITQFSKINLTQVNKPLNWPYSDEIGLLIKEYNRTLLKLENSTALLAKSERESAWREMARQIAHEIKNPLTPMSLSLQSLQAAINRNDPKVPELTQRMTTTVLEQIKVLTRTASNFSEFATMTDIVARKESLIDILESTTGIYSDSDDAEFLFVLPQKDIPVFVDKVKLIRVLTNIIQNAIQSIPDDITGKIMLTVTKENKNIVDITITDNGGGIPLELKGKIFEPNFTTKSYGSGLGLAMCKDIMQKSSGDIYFESTIGMGSSFHITLPIYQEKDKD